MTRPPVGALPPDVLRRIAPVRKLALETGTTLYLVGGAVRDLLLGRAITDLDLVVEADAVVFARRLAHDLHAAVETHRRFGTAVLRLPEGERLDVATARAEDYETPGALPRVRAGSIDDDLARRDFTVNAMAMRIGRSNRPDFLDPFGGRRDLRARLVRALHPRSFFDDPTRAFRAVRYAWSPVVYVSCRPDRISGDRLRREIVLLFAEPDRAAAVSEMAALGLSRTIHPALASDQGVARRLRRAERIATQTGRNGSWLVYLLSWMGDLPTDAAAAVARRLNLSTAPAKAVRGWPMARKSLGESADLGAARLAERIEALDDDSVVAAAAEASAPLARRILSIAEAAPQFRLTIRGQDLVAAGIPPGPAIGRALSATLSARQDGAIQPEQELAFALKAARS